MGILPLQFLPGENSASIGIDGTEIISIEGLDDELVPSSQLHVTAIDSQGGSKRFKTQCRLDSKIEIDYYRNDGILQYMLRQFIARA